MHLFAIFFGAFYESLSNKVETQRQQAFFSYGWLVVGEPAIAQTPVAKALVRSNEIRLQSNHPSPHGITSPSLDENHNLVLRAMKHEK